MGGSPWEVVTLKLSVGDGSGSMPNSFGPYTCSFEIFLLFCSLMDARVHSIPDLEVNRCLVWAEGFCYKKGWLVPLEMGLSRRMLRHLSKVSSRDGATLFASISRVGFCLRLLSSFSFMPMRRCVFFLAHTLAQTLAFYLLLEVQVLGGLVISPVLNEWWLPHWLGHLSSVR